MHIYHDSENYSIGSSHMTTDNTAEVVRETAIQGHSRSSVVVPIDTAYMTSY